jgi:hypothetical protein
LQLKNMSLPPLPGINWYWRGHCRHLPGAASPGYVALDLCYISWLKSDFQQD